MDDLFTAPELLPDRVRELIRLNNWTGITEQQVDQLGPPPNAVLRARQFLSIGIYFENEVRTGKMLIEAFYKSYPVGSCGFGGYHALPYFVRDRNDRHRWPRNTLRWVKIDISEVPTIWHPAQDFDHQEAHFEIFAALLLHPSWKQRVGIADEPAVAVPGVTAGLHADHERECVLFGNMPFFGTFRPGEYYLELWSCSPYYFMTGGLPYKVALPSIVRY